MKENAPVKWLPKYSVGIESIDEQHKKLLDLINALAPHVGENYTAQLQPVLDDLILYTREHFKTEETLFKQYDYPHYTEHKHYHDHFVAKVMEFLKDFLGHKTTLTRDMHDYLFQWLEEHMLVEDQKYVEFFRLQGVK